MAFLRDQAEILLIDPVVVPYRYPARRDARQQAEHCKFRDTVSGSLPVTARHFPIQSPSPDRPGNICLVPDEQCQQDSHHRQHDVNQCTTFHVSLPLSHPSSSGMPGRDRLPCTSYSDEPAKISAPWHAQAGRTDNGKALLCHGRISRHSP